MKKKALLSSLLIVLLCVSLIAGSTYALFADSNEISITVTSANVDLEANIGELTLYSAKADANGDLIDENGNKYVHDKQEGAKFSNGGTASYDTDTQTLSIELITPGDKIEIPVQVTNNSNVTVQYRYVVKCVDEATDQSLTVGENSLYFYSNGMPYLVKGMAFYSGWEILQPGEAIPDTVITFELPISAGNDYQNLEANFVILVEAVQANGVVDGVLDTDDDANEIESGIFVGDGD